MSQYFYIFLDFALVFGGCVLLLIGAIYAGFYLVVRRTGKRLATEVNKIVTERLEKERNTRTIPLRAETNALRKMRDIFNNGGKQ